VIGWLRFVGLTNAAVWFGAAVFCLLGALPAASSREMEQLLGSNNFPFFSVAIGQVIEARYFHWHLLCSAVALLHLVAEWLYFGKYPQKVALGLLAGLCLIGFVQAYWLQPRLKDLHEAQRSRAQQREPAARAYQFSHGSAQVLNVLMLGGLALYLWRLANPPDVTRFVTPAKFRS
jgi:hypothetical protein